MAHDPDSRSPSHNHSRRTYDDDRIDARRPGKFNDPPSRRDRSPIDRKGDTYRKRRYEEDDRKSHSYRREREPPEDERDIKRNRYDDRDRDRERKHPDGRERDRDYRDRERHGRPDPSHRQHSPRPSRAAPHSPSPPPPRRSRGRSPSSGRPRSRSARSRSRSKPGSRALSEDKTKPNFKPSGLLAADTKTVILADGTSTVLKYHEPPEARKPLVEWRLYVFKGSEQLDLLHLHRQSAYLIGRDRAVADIAIDHPSCSKQHAVIQYRQLQEKNESGASKSKIKPFIIDLESTNGTHVNGEAIPTSRYYELQVNDVIKFGLSEREYVLINDVV